MNSITAEEFNQLERGDLVKTSQGFEGFVLQTGLKIDRPDTPVVKLSVINPIFKRQYFFRTEIIEIIKKPKQ